MYNIYYIFNSKTNKYYIGMTSLKVVERIRIHFQSLKKLNHRNKYLQNDWNKMNASLSFSTLEKDLTKEQAKIRERYWIKYYNSLYPNGYNIYDGNKVTDIVDRVNNKSENNPMYGIRKFGEDNPNCKYPIEKCIKIKNWLLKGNSIKKTANDLKVSVDIVKQIRTGKHWSSKYIGGSFKDWLEEKH